MKWLSSKVQFEKDAVAPVCDASTAASSVPPKLANVQAAQAQRVVYGVQASHGRCGALAGTCPHCPDIGNLIQVVERMSVLLCGRASCMLMRPVHTTN